MKKSFYFCLFLFLVITITGCKAKIQNLNTTDKVNYSCKYKDITRTFTFYKPDVSNMTQASLVLMLHGYGSCAKDFEHQTKFASSALKRGYAVAFIDGITDPDDKTSSAGWNSGMKKSNKDDLGFLESLIISLQKEYGFSNIFAAGFSNGAFMIHRLAVESDKFTAVASVAGFLPKHIWDERPKKINCAFLQINGSKDDVVPMHLNGSSKVNINPAIEDVIEYYKSAYKNSELIQHIVIQDGRHSWPEQQFCGFDVNEVILDFFDSTCKK